jgi:hypothetical protein
MKIIILSIILAATTAFSQTYNRSDYGTWIDADKDCQNTRQEVLIEESLVPATLDPENCKVISGLWFDIYSGKLFTNPSDLDIDHLVPLENAHISGGYEWNQSKKKEYSNYLGEKIHLIAVSKSSNRSKQNKSPDRWLPTFEPVRCAYVKEWKNVKVKWNLSMNEEEKTFIDNYIKECN